MSPLKVAVLDDYQGAAEAQFKALDPAKYEVTIFRDTLPAYNHPDTPDKVKDELANRLSPFAIICTMRERTPFPAALVDRLPNLQLLLTTGVRNASLDIPALKARGVPVGGAQDEERKAVEGPDGTTQHCVSLILGAARNLAADDAAVKSPPGTTWQTGFAMSLTGRTLGLVGLGRLGVAVGRIMASAFGMRVVAWSSSLTQEGADEKARAAGLPVERGDGTKTFRVVSKEELFRTADVVSVHYVLSDRSRGVVAARELEMMQPHAVLVNTSRGPLVVEEDLLRVLEEGRIRAAALDVFAVEPLPADSPWRTTKWGQEGRSQVLLTPHMGYVSKDTIDRWYEINVADIGRWERGEPLSLALY